MYSFVRFGKCLKLRSLFWWLEYYLISLSIVKVLVWRGKVKGCLSEYILKFIWIFFRWVEVNVGIWFICVKLYLKDINWRCFRWVEYVNVLRFLFVIRIRVCKYLRGLMLICFLVKFKWSICMFVYFWSFFFGIFKFMFFFGISYYSFEDLNLVYLDDCNLIFIKLG